jgi:hypothetical protein
VSAKVKYGLIAGGIALVLNICISTLFGICGPGVALIAGVAAGLLAVREEGGGARTGLIAGAIAGALVLVAQIIAGLGALILFQSTGMGQDFGLTPQLESQIGYWAGGLGAGLCFGIVDVALAAGGGAGAAALAGGKSEPQENPPL